VITSQKENMTHLVDDNHMANEAVHHGKEEDGMRKAVVRQQLITFQRGAF
jgi:hypothetical protein